MWLAKHVNKYIVLHGILAISPLYCMLLWACSAFPLRISPCPPLLQQHKGSAGASHPAGQCTSLPLHAKSADCVHAVLLHRLSLDKEDIMNWGKHTKDDVLLYSCLSAKWENNDAIDKAVTRSLGDKKVCTRVSKIPTELSGSVFKNSCRSCKSCFKAFLQLMLSL